MKKTSQLVILCIVLFMATSCGQHSHESIAVSRINGRNLEQTAPYLTTDNKGNAVLCWTAKAPTDSLNRLMYSVYDTDKDIFRKPVVVSVSAGTKSSAESMNKVAFKSDGTVIAIFAKRFENKTNPYAGAICYSMSSDEGLSWSPAQYIHSDTSHIYGRGYFDVSTLKNGEIGAVWLDGRYKKAIKGSAIFFSRTEKGGGFKGDTCINKNTCECCRTDLLADKNGNIHIAYRSIMYPGALMGKQVRDMVYTFSGDNGKTFAPQQVISKDNWMIEGCPHTGPSMAMTETGINAVWFTASGNTGLYRSSKSLTDTNFNGRDLLTANGRHPQLVSFADGKLAMVYEENEKVESYHKGSEAAQMHSHARMSHNSPAPAAKIILRIINTGKEDEIINLTDGKLPDHHPVLVPVKDGVLIAWVREQNNKPSIRFTRVKLL